MADLLTIPALAALSRIAFDATLDRQSIWTDDTGHVADINADLVSRVIQDFQRQALPRPHVRPVGWAAVGPAGSGKTHLLMTLRGAVHARGGWFVLLDLQDMDDFWTSAALGFVESLIQPMASGASQGLAVLDRLRARFGLAEAVTRDLTGSSHEVWSRAARAFAAAIRHEDTRGMLAHRDAVFACLGLLSGHGDLQDYGRAWLIGTEIDAAGRLALQLLQPGVTPRRATQGLSWLMSLAGPTLCAIDQIDALIGPLQPASGLPDTAGSNTPGGVGDPPGRIAGERAARLAIGLMDLRELTQRTVTVVTALEQAWTALTRAAPASFPARFQVAGLRPIGSPRIARQLVEQLLARDFAADGFAPPYPSWPFRAEAFDGAAGFSPRELLQACQAHIDACRQRGEVRELAAFPGAPPQPVEAPASTPAPLAAAPPAAPLPAAPPPDAAVTAPAVAASAEVVSLIQRRYEELCALPPPPGLLDLGGDDARVVELLIAALQALVRQTVVPPTQALVFEAATSGLHARVRQIDHAAGGRERQFGFRAIAHGTTIAALIRLQAAMTGLGIDGEAPDRQLIVLRRDAWPSGSRLASLLRDFDRSGGRTAAPDAEDFARFAALRTLLDEAPPGLDDWLRSQRPLAASHFFQNLGLAGDALTLAAAAWPAAAPAGAADALAAERPPPRLAAPIEAAHIDASLTDPATIGEEPAPAAPTAPGVTPQLPDLLADAIPFGLHPQTGQPVVLSQAMLSRHVAVIAGAGASKTLLLRRVVEEAALVGVPSVVLDSSTDFAALSRPWPERPGAFTDADTVKAARFAAEADVVIWTPGQLGGNPLTLPVLPDFTTLGAVAAEREQAVALATATVMRLIAGGDQAGDPRADVLADALRHFARQRGSGGSSGGGLPDLIELLYNLPHEAAAAPAAAGMAGEMADDLVTLLETHPAIDQPDAATDLTMLLHGARDKVRVSVVTLIGLADEAAREDYVRRLVQAMFVQVRRHPAAPGQPLAGLLVLDEAQSFAPSDGPPSGGEALLALMRQARAYGFGVVLATHAANALDISIVTECATRIFGFTKSQAALQAAGEVLRRHGGNADELGHLPRDEFLLTGNAGKPPERFVAPVCLTHNPIIPPAEDDVIEWAARGRLVDSAQRPPAARQAAMLSAGALPPPG